MAGAPTYSATNTGFRDNATTYFKKEVAWLAAQGVTTGYPDGTFRPRDDVKRDAMAAFMYRLSNKKDLVAY